MTGPHPTTSKGQQVSDLLALLADLTSATQVVLTPREAALAREGLCLLAKAEAADAGHVAEVAATAAGRPHEVAPLGIRDWQRQVPATPLAEGDYPLYAICARCNQPAAKASRLTPWRHDTPRGWPVPAQPLANDDPPGRQRDQLCPEHGRYCVHL